MDRPLSLPKPVRLALALGLVALLLGLVGLALWFFTQLSPTGANKVTVEIKPGTIRGVLITQLQRDGLIRSPLVFAWVLDVMNALPVRAGYYDLSGTMDMPTLARTLRQGGRPRIKTITVPEGFRLADIVARLVGNGLGNAAALNAAFSQPTWPEWLKGTSNLEGFLFPATYQFSPEATPTMIRAAMLRRFIAELTPERQRILTARSISIYQWVTLASMVQAEAGNELEMPVIAGVFLNRLDDRMRLQSDPTVAYGLGKRLNQLDRNAGDFANDTPYNSYLRYGLPPTPINNPGSAALAAVLDPQRQNKQGERWLYFLHGRNGTFYPNTNFNDHMRDNAGAR
jgi:UPF0755 protein